MEPLGLRMLIGLVAIHLLMTGESVLKKLLVLPVSAMIEDNGSGGPTGKVDSNEVSILLGASVVFVFGGVGVPRRQVGGRRCERKPLVMVLLPPCILLAVAWVL
jgi:hypothetical protein